MSNTAFTYGGINCSSANWKSIFGIISSSTGTITIQYKTGSGSYVDLPTSGYLPVENYTLKVTQLENEDYLAGTLEKAFSVTQATLRYEAKILTATYGYILSELVSQLGAPKGVNGSDLECTWNWANSSTPVGDAGIEPQTYSATFTPNDTNYESVTEDNVKITVNKAMPNYTYQQNVLQATVG